jgi:hypothetical protein
MERRLFAILLGFALAFPWVQIASASELPEQKVAALGDADFQVREKAQVELLDWARLQPDRSIAELLKRSRASGDPEIRERCFSILRELVLDRYNQEGSGFLGVGRAYQSVNIPGKSNRAHGVVVTSIRRGTPADRCGIQVNDVIFSLNGKGWRDESASDVFADQIAAEQPGTKVRLEVLRNGQVIRVDAVLVRRPENANFLFFEGANFDPEDEERKAMEAYFRDWLNQQKP